MAESMYFWYGHGWAWMGGGGGVSRLGTNVSDAKVVSIDGWWAMVCDGV